MKIVIDIPDEIYASKQYCDYFFAWSGKLSETFRNGIPLSDVLRNIRSDIWDAGVNMTGEYQGVWTRFRDVEKAFDKALKEESELPEEDGDLQKMEWECEA